MAPIPQPYLAQINIVRTMRNIINDPVIKGFVDQLDEIKQLAEVSPGLFRAYKRNKVMLPKATYFTMGRSLSILPFETHSLS